MPPSKVARLWLMGGWAIYRVEMGAYVPLNLIFSTASVRMRHRTLPCHWPPRKIWGCASLYCGVANWGMGTSSTSSARPDLNRAQVTEYDSRVHRAPRPSACGSWFLTASPDDLHVAQIRLFQKWRCQRQITMHVTSCNRSKCTSVFCIMWIQNNTSVQFWVGVSLRLVIWKLPLSTIDAV